MFDQNPNQPNSNNQVEDILAGVDDRPVLKEVISSNIQSTLEDDSATHLATHKLLKIVMLGVVVPCVVLAGGFAAYKFVPKNEKKIIETVAPLTNKVIPQENNTITETVTETVTITTPEVEIKPEVVNEVVDTDNDGLTDYEEVKKYQTDPLIADTDSDGYTDGSEVAKGYNPRGAGKLNLVD